MWRRLPRHVAVMFASAIVAVSVLFVVYRLIDPLPPRRLTIAAGTPGSVYDNFARHYARILARDGVTLEVRPSAGALEGLEMLRDDASGVQAALTAFGFEQAHDGDILYSLGGVFDAPVFIFYRSAEPIAKLGQLRGKRLAVGMPGTALRALMLQVLENSGALGASGDLVDLDYSQAIDALIAGKIDVAVLAS